MNREKIQQAIQFLDSEIARDNAHVRLQQYGGGPDEGQIIANEAGYLRLGIEFLKAAFSDPRSNQEPPHIDVDLDYLITADSSINFDWFERREFPVSESGTAGTDVISMLLACSFIAAVLLAVIGLVTVAGWISS